MAMSENVNHLVHTVSNDMISIRGPDRRKRKRSYRQRVICAECKREVDFDYKDNHAKTVHKGKKVAFVMVRERNQSQLAFSNKSSNCKLVFFGSKFFMLP